MTPVLDSRPAGRTNKNARQQPGVGQNESTSQAFSTSALDSVKKFPSPETVKGRVLGALLRGERITHLDCWRRFGSARLSHHVYELRRGAGWLVLMDEINVTTSDGGRTATIGVYYLTADAIAAAGDEGQDYAAECLHIEHERRAA